MVTPPPLADMPRKATAQAVIPDRPRKPVGRKPTLAVPKLPHLKRPAIPPLLGSDLDRLRTALSGSDKPIPTQDIMYELGLQRTRYAEMRKLGDLPILKPRIEIICRLLEEFPQFSYNQDEYLPATVLTLMDAVRPERQHTMRDLSILLGYEMSSHLPWSKGKAMLPTPKRILRFLYRGLSEGEIADRRAFLEQFEQIVLAIALGHGISAPTLARSGFKHYRKFRKETWKDADKADDEG